MKLKNASVKIAVGIVNIVVIIIGPNELGMRCPHNNRLSFAPNVLDANTNSCPFNFRICPLIIRAIFTHPVITIASVMDTIPGCNTSINKMMTIKLRSEEHTSELQSRGHLVCRLLLEKKKQVERYTQRMYPQ